MTTVEEIRDALDQLVEMGFGSSPIRLAVQPNYPLQELVEGLWLADEDSLEGTVVYIVSGGSDYDQPYAPKQAFDNAILHF